MLEALAAPFLVDSTAALYHLLQAVIWAFTGWLTGRLTLEDRVQYTRPRSTLALLTAAVFLLGGLQLLLSGGLARPTHPSPCSITCCRTRCSRSSPLRWPSLLAFFVEYPWNPPKPIAAPSYAPVAPPGSELPPPPAPSASSAAPRVKTEKNAEKDEDPLIMIELD